jgi:IS30 family transposase
MHPHREKVLTMTYDNGKEFAHHAVTDHFKMHHL